MLWSKKTILHFASLGNSRAFLKIPREELDTTSVIRVLVEQRRIPVRHFCKHPTYVVAKRGCADLLDFLLRHCRQDTKLIEEAYLGGVHGDIPSILDMCFKRFGYNDKILEMIWDNVISGEDGHRPIRVYLCSVSPSHIRRQFRSLEQDMDQPQRKKSSLISMTSDEHIA